MSIFSKLFGPDPETEKQTAFEEIERQFEGAEINQAKAGWLTMRGNSYAMSRKFDMAISDFKEALEYEPDRPTTLVSLGGAYNHNKMWKDGISKLEKAKEFVSSIENDLIRAGQEHNLYYELGHAYFFSGNKQKAFEHLSVSLSEASALGVYKDCGDIGEKEWVAIRSMRKNAELLCARIKKEEERNEVSIMRGSFEVSPPEYSGFEEFFTKYYKDSSFTEQNKYILSIFPVDFWKNIDVSFKDVSKHADIFFQSEDKEFTKAIVEKNDPWLTEHGGNIYVAMKIVTAWGKELMKSENFRNKCADIALAELQNLGLKMLTLLPKEDQKKFLEECQRHYPPSTEPDFPFLAMRVWADVACTPLAETNGLISKKKDSFPRRNLSDVIEKLGFIATIAWLRELPHYRNFDKHSQKCFPFLLDIKALKNFIAFDSVFFPYAGKRR